MEKEKSQSEVGGYRGRITDEVPMARQQREPGPCADDLVAFVREPHVRIENNRGCWLYTTETHKLENPRGGPSA